MNLHSPRDGKNRLAMRRAICDSGGDADHPGRCVIVGPTPHTDNRGNHSTKALRYPKYHCPLSIHEEKDRSFFATFPLFLYEQVIVHPSILLSNTMSESGNPVTG